MRMEDHDMSRARPEHEAAIYADVRWLGIPVSDMPVIDVPSANRQSDNSDVYMQAVHDLAQHHKVYACQCSRKELQDQAHAAAGETAGETAGSGKEVPYPGTCRDKGIPLDTPGCGLRVVLPQESVSFVDLCVGEQSQIPSTQCGDILLRDRLGQWTYQWSVVVDDLRHGVNLIVRGEDLLSSTGRQILLRRMLLRARGNATTEPNANTDTDGSDVIAWFHHPLVYESSGAKLSKRQFSEGIHQRRERGEAASEIWREAAILMGIPVIPADAGWDKWWHI